MHLETEGLDAFQFSSIEVFYGHHIPLHTLIHPPHNITNRSLGKQLNHMEKTTHLSKKKKKRKKEKRKKEKEIWKLLLQTFGAVEPWQLGFTSPHENPFKYYKGHISSLKATPLIKWLKPFIIALQTLSPHNHPQTPLKFEPPGSVFLQNLQTTILFYKAPPLVCKTMKPFL